jgi:hypothetical protein
MLLEQHAEYIADPLSARKAVAVSMFANHISEHVFAAYPATSRKCVDAEQGDNSKEQPDGSKFKEGFPVAKGPGLRWR